ncbi:hypothetical protein ACIOMM_13555 [Streptomyces sp. NPDC087908]|uniref:hypothetical protein n=1 Tax=unclassified Streptomyces TaxID=2593676 RepID=UPI0011CEB096|nr:hypothetical protein [Streptomyces sp. adm13(2018)]TXS04643.1 hypothetical protein EAO70_37100 [Streptomyces sp. adm13(2018)]
MEAHERDPYPDVTAAGGLVAALRQEAEARGRDIGLSPHATEAVGMETRRGYLSVDTAGGERRFRLRTSIPDFGWDIGGTSDLGTLVDAIAAWREGVPLDALKARFDFLDLDAFTGALAAGEPTASQWAGLLSSAYYRPQRNLLHRLHADEVLRNAFPTMTHRAVRLQVDPMDHTSRQVLVEEPDEGHYSVVRVGVPGAEWTEVPGDRLITYLRTALDEDRPE